MYNARTYKIFDKATHRKKEGASVIKAPSKMGSVSEVNPCIWFHYHL